MRNRLTAREAAVRIDCQIAQWSPKDQPLEVVGQIVENLTGGKNLERERGIFFSVKRPELREKSILAEAGIKKAAAFYRAAA